MTSSALQIQGDNTGSTYAATANGSGSFTVNGEAADGSLGNNQDFTYSLHATDTFGASHRLVVNFIAVAGS